MSTDKRPRRAEACVWDDAIEIVKKHRRHAQRSPGIGLAEREYAVLCLDDVLADLNAKRTEVLKESE